MRIVLRNFKTRQYPQDVDGSMESRQGIGNWAG
jgi:hypothetical protein